ncbi:hypothetical protein ES703_85808 [subsurface metagenome]
MATGPQIPIAATDLCFGCGQKNPIGLKLRFEWDGKTVKGEFTPTELHQGWRDTIHGGILTTLMDEAMGYATYFENIPAVTATIEVRLRRPVLIGQRLLITASVTKRARRLTETEAKLTLVDGTVVAEAKATQFIGSSFSDERSKPNNAQ